MKNGPDWIPMTLRWAVTGILLGRAWQYLVWDGPWRSLFWDESLMAGIVEMWGWEWSAWAESLAVGQGITYFTAGLGLLFLLGGLLAWWPAAAQRRWIWYGLSLLLFLHTLLNWKGHAWQWGYLLEHSLQWTTPLWFTLLGTTQQRSALAWQAAKLAIAFTFIGHGLYAMGYYPVPPHFVGMMMSGFGLSESWARAALWAIGWVDVLVAFALFLPAGRTRRWAVLYIIIWGLLTALARLYANAAWYDWTELFTQWLPEFAVRWCHFLVPLALLGYWNRSRTATESPSSAQPARDPQGT